MHVCFVHDVCFFVHVPVCICVCMCVWRETERERERETETKKQRQRHNRVGRVVTFWEFFYFYFKTWYVFTLAFFFKNYKIP